MDRTAALARLSRMVAADQRPVLSTGALSDLLDDSRTVDAEGRRITDSGYVPTYNLNRAAMRGWEHKAGLVAGDFTFQADGASYGKGAVLANMERMVAMYRAKDNGVMTVRDDRANGLEAGLRLGVNSGTVT